MNITCIIQARLGSKRFPQKILKKVEGKSIIELIISRLKLSKKINQIVVAIPKTKIDDKLNDFLKKRKITIFRGSEKNVLKRYYDAANYFKSNTIVRITSDCPLVDYKIIDKMIDILNKKKKIILRMQVPLHFRMAWI